MLHFNATHYIARTAVDRYGDVTANTMQPQRKNRGRPPPATFDIDTLPGSANLTVLEACAVLRRTPSALELWRRDPDHALKWRYVDGKPLYRADAVREYMELRNQQTKKGPPRKAALREQ